MKLFFFLVFITLVVLFAADFDNIGNLQFITTAIAFTVYLGFLTGSINMSTTNLPPPLDKYVELPYKIKDMIGNEFDLYQRLFHGMKDAKGNQPNETSFDEKALAPLKGNELSNVQQEYHAIDKVFRDLLIADSNLYIQKIYNPGNTLM